MTRTKPAEVIAANTAERIIRVAREIVAETGDFDLPMRELALRARVSLRTPYALFGSKAGVITAILQEDQGHFRDQIRGLQTRDPLVDLFENLRLGILFFSQRPSFYRSLFRATQTYSNGGESEPGRENLRPLSKICRRAHRDGLLIPGMRPEILAETLTDIVASNMRDWANSDYDIEYAHMRTAFGYASVLASVLVEPAASALRTKIMEFHGRIAALKPTAPGN